MFNGMSFLTEYFVGGGVCFVGRADERKDADEEGKKREFRAGQGMKKSLLGCTY
jgi:hypothetical protein